MTKFYEHSKKNILGPLWAVSGYFRAKKKIYGKSTCHSFLFLDFYRSAKLHKKTNEQISRKTRSDVRTKGGRADRQAWIHRTSLSRGPKMFAQYRKKINSGGLWVFLLLQLLEKVSFNVNMFRSLPPILGLRKGTRGYSGNSHYQQTALIGQDVFLSLLQS